jgi:UDP-glucose 4-epimerase
MAILVTGGAGYIGSHMVHALLDRGDDVVVLDNLVTGVRSLVAERAAFVEGNVADGELVRRIVKDHKVTAVIHFAGSVVVPDSVENPLAYYSNNTAASRNLIEACVRAEVGNFVFSSTAAVYGMPEQIPVAENAPTNPINPYGRSKLMTEWMLEDSARAYDFRFVALRYFNVAGADPKGRTGQSTPRATHLIKRACQAALGRVPALEIFGTDYPTKDGTGVRDYIHVSDLANAHIHALDHLELGGNSIILNCGYGHGFSVREVVETVSRVTGEAIPTREAPRRAGDPASIVADPSQIKEVFEWQPKYDDLDEIVRGAYAWERRLNSI